MAGGRSRVQPTARRCTTIAETPSAPVSAAGLRRILSASGELTYIAELTDNDMYGLIKLGLPDDMATEAAALFWADPLLPVF